MRFKRKALALAGVAVAGALVLAGCSGGTSTGGASGGTGGGAATAGFNTAVDGVVNPSTKAGGTLKLLSSSDCDAWDPARTYYGWCLNMQRVFSRTLVNYSKVNGTKFQLAPDLATDMGTHNADYTEWKYTLQNGLKYSDGSAIKAEDIKYAVSRFYAQDVINGGPTFYFTEIIDAPSSYKGPYAGSKSLLPDSAVEVSGNTITFHLKKSFADFNYLLALPTSAPVPQAKDTGANYTKKPISSGPYEFSSYTPQKSVTFTKNKYWDKSTDKIRKPLADEIDLTINSNDVDVDNQLNAGNADTRVDATVGPAFRAKIFQSADKKKQADNPGGPTTRYYAIAASVPPLDNVHCRRAVFYALDKASLLQIAGGTSAGAIAQSATPPGIPGYDPSFDPYPNGKTHQGDVAKAKQELAACGQPNGFSTKFAYSTPDATNGKALAAIQASLGKAGIKVTGAAQSAESYYSTYIGSPSNVKKQGLGIMAAGWGADFPTMYGFFQNIVNGSTIRDPGTSNYASINDDTVDKILDDTGTPATQELGTQLNKALMETAQFLPTRFDKTVWYRNPRLTNVTSNNALGFGAYDVVNVGVSDGK